MKQKSKAKLKNLIDLQLQKLNQQNSVLITNTVVCFPAL